MDRALRGDRCGRRGIRVSTCCADPENVLASRAGHHGHGRSARPNTMNAVAIARDPAARASAVRDLAVPSVYTDTRETITPANANAVAPAATPTAAGGITPRAPPPPPPAQRPPAP